MKNKFIGLAILWCLLASFSCGKDDDLKVQNIDDEFKDYVASFVNEGALRGLDINFEDYNVDIVFGDLDTLQLSGVCDEISSDDDFEITIDEDIWPRLNSRQREELIFHELGHCFLGRPHKNELISLGEVCMSTMSSGGFCMRDLYDKNWKKYYIDELFNESAPVPDWYAEPVVEAYENVEVLLNIQDTVISNLNLLGLDLSSYDSYEFEFVIPEQSIRFGMLINNYYVHFNLVNFQSFYVMDSTEIDFPLERGFRFPAGFVSSQAVGFSGRLYYYGSSVTNGNMRPDFSIAIKVKFINEFMYFYVNDDLRFVKHNDTGDVIDFRIPQMIPNQIQTLSLIGLSN